MAKRKHPLKTYVKHAILHPWHIVVLAGSIVFGISNWSLLVLLLVFAGAEIAVLAIVLSLSSFREYVDDIITQRERIVAAEQRAMVLLKKVSDEHRTELITLEHIVDCGKNLLTDMPVALASFETECNELLQTYLNLIISHHTLEDSMTPDCIARHGNLLAVYKEMPLPILKHRIGILNKAIDMRKSRAKLLLELRHKIDATHDMILYVCECALTQAFSASIAEDPVVRARVASYDELPNNLELVVDAPIVVDYAVMALGKSTR